MAKKSVLRVPLAVEPPCSAEPISAFNPARAMGFQSPPTLLSPTPSLLGRKPGGGASPPGGLSSSSSSSHRAPTLGEARRVVTWRWASDGDMGVGALFFPTPSATARAAPPQTIVAPFTKARGQRSAPLAACLVASAAHTSLALAPMRACLAPVRACLTAEGNGEWVVAGEGTVVFEFDNSDAAILGRAVSYAVAVHDLPPDFDPGNYVKSE